MPTSAELPPRFVGAWQRRSIALDGGEPFESHHVIWLQGPSLHADLRCPLGPGGGFTCFAGTTHWDAPFLRWRHEIELAQAAGDDVGEVSWDGEDLVEQGTFGTTRYREVWRRVGPAGAPVAEVRAVSSIVVTVGPHRLAVVDQRPRGGEFRATYWVGNEVARCIGAPLPPTA